MKKQTGIILVSSLALFSMFFGAGNLIFPPSLGFRAGTDFGWSMLGFLTTGVGLVVLSAIASVKSGGTIDSISKNVGRGFSILFGTLVLLAIGPLLAIPRTAATTHEIIRGSLLPGLSPTISSIIFFIIVLFFVLHPKNIIDSLGKILTPALLTILLVILGCGFVEPIGPVGEPDMANAFTESLLEGYQTMDALAALVFTMIITEGMICKGVKEKKDIVKFTSISAIVAGIGLCIVYGGLLYIGATMSELPLDGTDRVHLLITATDSLLGGFGKYALALAVTLACLTTAIGITSTLGLFFEEVTKGKLKYLHVVIISSVFSGVLAIEGVTNIINFAATILSVLYPVAIVLIFLNLFPNIFKTKAIYKGAVAGALIPTLLAFIIDINTFLWIPSAIVCGLIFYLLSPKVKTVKV